MENSRQIWSGLFALGLVVGGGLTVLLLIWIFGLDYCPLLPCPDEPGFAYWVPFASGPDTTNSLSAADIRGHEDFYLHQDLRAQETMARATNALVLLAFVSAIIGIVGSFALIWNLFESRKAISLSSDANRIALEDNRPWLDFELVDIGSYGAVFGEDREILGFWISPAVEVVNYGKSPARRVAIRHVFMEGPSFSLTEALSDIGDSPMEAFARKTVFPDKKALFEKVVQQHNFETIDWDNQAVSIYMLTVLEYQNSSNWFRTIKVHILPTPHAKELKDGQCEIAEDSVHHIDVFDTYD